MYIKCNIKIGALNVGRVNQKEELVEIVKQNKEVTETEEKPKNTNDYGNYFMRGQE